MSKKDYKLLAEVINKWVRNDSLRALLFVEIGAVLQAENPRFDANKWHMAREKGDK